MKEHGPWKTKNTITAYESPWIRVDHSEVINPGGVDGTYSTVHFKNLAIGIITLDDDMNTWIVGQYRYPLHTYTWEIPEGGGALKEPPLKSAKRELLEEVGLKAKRWDLIQEMVLSNSATDEVAYIYLARGLEQFDPEPEEDEEIEIKKLPFDEFYQMILDGEILDSLSVADGLKLKLMIDNGELN